MLLLCQTYIVIVIFTYLNKSVVQKSFQSAVILFLLIRPCRTVHYTNIGIYKTGILQLIFIYIYNNTLKGRWTGSSHMII